MIYLNRMIDLSIIVLTWNTANITKKCIDSLITKLKNIRYEIIVTDNGSTDNTKEIFSNLKSVKYVNTGSNLGFSKGNNIGALHASGKYYLFLNSDMEYISGLDNMLNYYIDTPNIGIIGPQFLNLDLTPQGSVFPPQTPLNSFKEFWLKLPAYSKYTPPTSSPVSVWSISGGAVLIKKTLFQKLSGWNEHFSFYFEDMDLCRRIRALGLNIFYFPDCQIIHQHGASAKQLTGVNTSYKKLVAGSIKYHGVFVHYLINFIIWSGQKWYRFLSIIHLLRDQNS